MKCSAGMLDLLEALTLPEQPVLFLKLTIQPHICMERLKDAVSQCIAFLPELALRYDKKHNCWRKQKDDTFSMIQEVEDFDFSSWDIEHHAQLCIQIIHKEQLDLVCIGYSHILCDGDGATQILRLLTACYRQETVSFQNCRTPESLPIIKLKKIKTKRRKTIPAALPFAPHPLHTSELHQSMSGKSSFLSAEKAKLVHCKFRWRFSGNTAWSGSSRLAGAACGCPSTNAGGKGTLF